MAKKRPPSKNKKPSKAGNKASIRPSGGAPGQSGSIAPRAVLLSWIAFGVVLLACIAWVAAHAYLVDTVTVRLCTQADQDLPVEKRMPVFLSEIAFDGYTWDRHAEHIGENGEWRLRHTDFDNAPKGRDQMAWNSAFAWYLRGMGEIYRSLTGDSLRNSIFRMSIWANPILLVLALGIFSTLSARRFGPLCGAVIALGMVAVPTFYEGFMPAYPDHHGLIAFTILGMLFGIAWAGAGWVQAPGGTDFVPPHSFKQAKHGMVFSAVCGAAGLWISPLSAAMVLGAIGAAALLATFIYGRPSKRNGFLQFHPELWKIWGVWGAGGSIFFYLLEYFPFNMGLHLEVNHPLYSLAWLGGAWTISLMGAYFSKLGSESNLFPWQKLVWPIAACALLPAVVLVGGTAVYSIMDPFLWHLHQNIAEFLPLMLRIKLGGLSWLMAFGWFPVFIAVALVLQFSSRTGRGTKAVLIFLSIPIFLITALQFYQVRWGMLAGPLYIALAGIVVPQVWKLIPRATLPRFLAAAILIFLGYIFIQPSFSNTFGIVWSQFRSGDKISITAGQGLAMLHRKMARAILDSAGNTPVVLLSSPNSSCLLSAIAGFKTLGTLYWDNVEGLKAAAAGLNAQSDDEALAFIKKHGITHVSLMTWENFVEPFFHILYPKPVPGKVLDQSFGKRALADRQIPVWARPLVFPPNDLTKGLQQQVLMLQVAPEQGLNEARFHLARFVRSVEGNPIQAEMTFREILESAPQSSLVRLELANLYVEQRRYDDAVDQVLKALPDGTPDIQANLTSQLAGDLIKAGQWSALAKLLRGAGSFPNASPTTLQNVAWILSTMPDAAARDPKFALASCDRLAKLPHDADSLTLARSAALAASGDFKAASKLLETVSSSDSANAELKGKAAAMRAAFDAGNVWTDGR
ncbi:MAG: tetratricopeptide repeat protein [Terrimicrobiaceae bacterium]